MIYMYIQEYVPDVILTLSTLVTACLHNTGTALDLKADLVFSC